MSGLYGWLKNNFGYSRKEINGTIVLFFGISVAFIFSYGWDYWLYSQNETPTEQELRELREWAADVRWKKIEAVKEPAESSVLAVNAPFDPHHVNREMLESMKLPDYVAGNWVKFVASGGKFFKKTDILRIYGLDSGMYAQLEPFISLAPSRRTTQKPLPVEKRLVSSSALPVKRAINSASAGELMEVKGIGPVLSERIVKYRNSLGGFYSKEQLKAVYGIKPEVLENLWQKFDMDSVSCCNKISLNTVSFDSLRTHPYLNYNQARAIVAYREQHGPFVDWRSVAEVRILPDSLVEKMKFYFELQKPQ